MNLPLLARPRTRTPSAAGGEDISLADSHVDSVTRIPRLELGLFLLNSFFHSGLGMRPFCSLGRSMPVDLPSPSLARTPRAACLICALALVERVSQVVEVDVTRLHNGVEEIYLVVRAQQLLWVVLEFPLSEDVFAVEGRVRVGDTSCNAPMAVTILKVEPGGSSLIMARLLSGYMFLGSVRSARTSG